MKICKLFHAAHWRRAAAHHSAHHCAEIKLRAERKGGEILKRQKETGERATGHKNLKIGTILPESLLVTPGSQRHRPDKKTVFKMVHS